MALEPSEEVGHEPCGTAEALDIENPPIRLHSEAVRGMLPFGRDLKTEMLAKT